MTSSPFSTRSLIDFHAINEAVTLLSLLTAYKTNSLSCFAAFEHYAMFSLEIAGDATNYLPHFGIEARHKLVLRYFKIW